MTAGFCQESLQAAPTPRGGPVAGGPGRVFILTAHDTSKLAPAQRAPVPSAHTETLFSVPSERSCATRGLSPAVSQRVPTTRWGEVGGAGRVRAQPPQERWDPAGPGSLFLGLSDPLLGGQLKRESQLGTGAVPSSGRWASPSAQLQGRPRPPLSRLVQKVQRPQQLSLWTCLLPLNCTAAWPGALLWDQMKLPRPCSGLAYELCAGAAR